MLWLETTLKSFYNYPTTSLRCEIKTFLVKILKFFDFKKITLAFLVHNVWSHYINGMGSGF